MGIHDRKYMSNDSYGRSTLGASPKSFTTKYVILCSILYLANELTEKSLALHLCLNPKFIYEFEVWRLFTAFVMLDGETQLIYGAVTLFVLYSLGNNIEAQIGTKPFINLLITLDRFRNFKIKFINIINRILFIYQFFLIN